MSNQPHASASLRQLAASLTGRPQHLGCRLGEYDPDGTVFVQPKHLNSAVNLLGGAAATSLDIPLRPCAARAQQPEVRRVATTPSLNANFSSLARAGSRVCTIARGCSSWHKVLMACHGVLDEQPRLIDLGQSVFTRDPLRSDLL